MRLLQLSISVLSIGLPALFSIISVPLIINHYGKELFGMYSLTADIVSYFTIFSFGIPTAVAAIFANTPDNYLRKKILNYGFQGIGVVFLCAVSVFGLFSAYPNLIISILGSFSEGVRCSVEMFFLILFISLAIRLPFSIFSQLLIYTGFVHWSKIIDILISASNFICILYCINSNLPFYDLAIYYGAFSIVLSFGYMGAFFYKVKPIPLEICSNFSQDHITRKNIYLNGYYYFITGIAGLLISSSDGLVISHFLNASMIPYFALPYKLIWVFIAILGQGLTLFIAKILILHQKNNHVSLQSLILKLVYFSLLLCCLGAVGSIFFSIEIVKAWSNGHIVIDNLTVILLALYLVSAGVSEVPYYILLSLNKVKKFYLLALLEGVSNLILSIYFIRVLGVAGVICATAISHIIFTSVYYNYILYKDYKNIYTSSIIKHLVKITFVVLVIMMMSIILVLYFKITAFFKVILLVLLTGAGAIYAKSKRYL